MSPKGFGLFRLLLLSWVSSWLVVCGIAGSAAADGDREDSSLYLGGGLAIGLEMFDLEGNYSSHDEAFGLDAWAGYRANRFLAIEGEFVYLGGYDSTIGGNSVDFDAIQFTLNLKAYPPVPGNYRPYLVGGVGGGRFAISSGPAKGHDKGGVFRFGGGIEMNFGTPVDLVAGVDYVITSGLAGADHLQIKIGFQRDF